MPVLLDNISHRLKINNKNIQALINNEEVFEFNKIPWIVPGKVKYGDEAIVLTVDITYTGNDYIYCVNGGSNTNYNWIVDWGDGIIETVSGSSSIFNWYGLTHKYLATGKYTIIIKPVIDNYTWAGSFGVGMGSSATWSELISVDYVTNKGFMQSNNSYGDYYMSYIYHKTGITYPANEVKTVSEDNITNISPRFKYSKYTSCTKLLITETEWLPPNIISIETMFRQAQYSNCNLLLETSAEYLPDNITTIDNSFRYGQYQNCNNLLISNHVHIRMNEFLNGSNNYYNMFRCQTTKSTPDTMPKYKDKLGNVYSITNLTPSARKYYCTNRTGIDGYASLHANWK